MGYKQYIVLSGSMEPALHTGSVCFVNTRYDYEDLVVGDIVAFENGEIVVTHRIVDVSDGANLLYITKGDANDIDDGYSVNMGNYKGRTEFSISVIGYFLNHLQSVKGKVIFFTAFASMMIVYFLIDYGEDEKKKVENDNNSMLEDISDAK